MIQPGVPKNEEERQKALESYQILDTIEEESFDNITSLIAYICDVPISLVSLLDNDRNFLKSHYGVPFNEDPRERSFCGHTILEQDGFLIIPDATKDSRFSDNPLVTEMGIRFYAGSALTDSNGLKLGALCVFGKEPKKLRKSQILALQQLSKQTMHLLESRLLNINLLKTKETLSQKNKELEQFAYLAAHDLKSPLRSISGMSQLLTKKYESNIDSTGKEWLQIINNSASQLSSLIDGLLDYSKSDYVLHENKSFIKLSDLEMEINHLFGKEEGVNLVFQWSISDIVTNKAALLQILTNLISNAIKYNDKEKIKVEIGAAPTTTHYEFYVEDNGPGITSKTQQKMFNLFSHSGLKDRYGKVGSGIGLATVKKIVNRCEGEIQVDSEMTKGTRFTFTIKK